MATTKKSDKESRGLAKQLASVTKQAKSLGINNATTAKAESMVAQTKREGGTAYKGSREEKAFLASDIGKTSPVIPPPPTVTDTGMGLDQGNASVVPEGFTILEGKIVKDEKASDITNATNAINANLAANAKGMLAYLNPEDNQNKKAYEETYGISEKQAGRDLRQAESRKSQYTAELNAITAARDAAVLGLEDTGRGQTTGFIGGEQGRIQRQAAIAALPVQAQLAAAQGDLEIAKSHVDSLFNMKIKDIDVEQAYKNTVANTWMSVANQQQQNSLNAAIADSNRRAAEKSQALAMANDWAKTAIEYGQSTLAGKIMKLDPTSKTFQQDLAVLQGQVSKPVAQGDGAPKVVDINGVSSIWNPTTGQYEAVTSVGATGGVAGLQKTGTVNDIEKILQFSDTQLQESLGKRNIIQRNIPGTSEYQFAIQHENLMNQLALAARGDLKGQGAVSDYEAKLLKSAQTTLNLYMDPAAYRKEAKQVRGAIQTSSGIPTYVKVTSSDGKQTKYAVLDSQSIQDAVNQGYGVEYQ